MIKFFLNPSKEGDSRKYKYDVVIHDQSQLQENLSSLQTKTSRLADLQKEVNTRDTFSSMATKVIYSTYEHSLRLKKRLSKRRGLL